LHDLNVFLTLTYDDDHLPPGGSLVKKDFQDFMKRLRFQHDGRIRYFAVGEYGDQLSRPHYHVCYFGTFPSDAKRLRSLSAERFATYESASWNRIWGKGHIHVGELTYASAQYAAGYIFKKLHGKLGEDHYKRVDADGVWHPIEPEFARMSLRPGIGRDWYERYSSDFHTHDVAVLDGKRFPVPKYYDRLLERSDPDRLAELREDRESKAIPFRPDNHPDRLAVKAEVALASIAQRDKRLQK